MHNYTETPKPETAVEQVSDAVESTTEETTEDNEVVANAPVAPIKKASKAKAPRDARPAIVKDPYGLDDQKKKDVVEELRPLKDEEGRHLCFRHVGNHQIFLYTQHLQTDPNFVPVYLSAEEIKEQARG